MIFTHKTLTLLIGVVNFKYYLFNKIKSCFLVYYSRQLQINYRQVRLLSDTNVGYYQGATCIIHSLICFHMTVWCISFWSTYFYITVWYIFIKLPVPCEGSNEAVFIAHLFLFFIHHCLYAVQANRNILLSFVVHSDMFSLVICLNALIISKPNWEWEKSVIYLKLYFCILYLLYNIYCNVL